MFNFDRNIVCHKKFMVLYLRISKIAWIIMDNLFAHNINLLIFMWFMKFHKVLVVVSWNFYLLCELGDFTTVVDDYLDYKNFRLYLGSRTINGLARYNSITQFHSVTVIILVRCFSFAQVTANSVIIWTRPASPWCTRAVGPFTRRTRDCK